ncbi:hypothetical protein VT98_11035, partial [Candidatus Electrothrix communis]
GPAARGVVQGYVCAGCGITAHRAKIFGKTDQGLNQPCRLAGKTIDFLAHLP